MISYAEKNTIEILKRSFGGVWKWCETSKKWVGEKFSVYKERNRLRRSDTGETLAYDYETNILKKSNLNYIRDTLKEKFGGEWEHDEVNRHWRSKECNFSVYRGTVVLDGKLHQVYRRSDTGVILNVKHNNRTLRLLDKKQRNMKNDPTLSAF